MSTPTTPSASSLTSEDIDVDDMGFVKVDFNDVKEYVVKNGVAGLEKKLQSKLDEWKDIPLNVAITGNAGTGKSSFINAIRGLTADDYGAAEVDVVEATTVPTPYEHPDNPNLRYWDLPGVGTPNFPRDTYLSDVTFEEYDFFLIFVSNRFTENDLWLAKEVQDKGKRLFFIRAKIDADMESNKRAHPKTHNEDDVLRKIRQNCQQTLDKANFESVDLFVLSNLETTRWDFPALTTRMITDLPDRKREAMTLSIGNFTTEIIGHKRAALGKRIKYIALASGAVGAIPLPGLSFGVDMGLLVSEANFYRQQLGLDDKSLESIALSAGVTKDMLKKMARLPSMARFTAQEITSLLVDQVASEAAEKTISYALPILGSVIAGGLSFSMTYSTLNDLLDDMEGNALKVLEVAVQKTSLV